MSKHITCCKYCMFTIFVSGTDKADNGSADLEMTVNTLIQIDKLVQLLESPVFTCKLQKALHRRASTDQVSRSPHPAPGTREISTLVQVSLRSPHASATIISVCSTQEQAEQRVCYWLSAHCSTHVRTSIQCPEPFEAKELRGRYFQRTTRPFCVRIRATEPAQSKRRRQCQVDRTSGQVQSHAGEGATHAAKCDHGRGYSSRPRDGSGEGAKGSASSTAKEHRVATKLASGSDERACYGCCSECGSRPQAQV